MLFEKNHKYLGGLYLLCLSSLMLIGCANAASVEHVGKDTGLYNCEPVGGKQAKKTGKTEKILSAQATEEIAKQSGSDPSSLAMVIAVGKDGKIKTFIPERVYKQRTLLCDFKYPLKADRIKNMDTINTIATENPKTCWTTSTGDQKCLVW